MGNGKSILGGYEAVKNAMRTALEFSDSEDQFTPEKLVTAYEAALNELGAPTSIYLDNSRMTQEEAALVEDLEKHLRMVDDKIGALSANPGVYLRLGHCAYHQMEIQLALENYDKALSIAPDNAEALKSKGLLLLRKKDYRAAEDSLSRALCQTPQDAEALYSEAYALGSLGRLAEATALCEKALTINPQVRLLFDFLNTSVAPSDGALKIFSSEILKP